jgi:glycerol-3-phosphate dehydrogenase
MLSMDQGAHGTLLAVSQGTHFVLPHSFITGSTALMIPKTADGRVLFAIPWHGSTIVGTTDEPVSGSSTEPRALASEKKFLFDHIGKYFGRKPAEDEILSVWSGLRPLVKKSGVKTSKLSRDHTILVSHSGLITVTGGKWTTYRRMGFDTINRACEVASLPKATSQTMELKIHGWTTSSSNASASEWERVYGSDLPFLQELSAENSGLDALLHPRLPFKGREVVWWRALLRMCLRGEPALCSSTRAPRLTQLRRLPIFWPRNLAEAKNGRRKIWLLFLKSQKAICTRKVTRHKETNPHALLTHSWIPSFEPGLKNAIQSRGS